MRNGLCEDLEAVSRGILDEPKISDLAKFHESNHRFNVSQESLSKDFWRKKKEYYAHLCRGAGDLHLQVSSDNPMLDENCYDYFDIVERANEKIHRETQKSKVGNGPKTIQNILEKFKL